LHIIFTFNSRDKIHFVSSEISWRPDKKDWDKIKSLSIDKYISVFILGISSKKPKELISGYSIQISTSSDSVNAPIFYRDVPLPFAFARAHVDSIKWRLCDISSYSLASVVIENLPVCANCHSFSSDGKYIGMDIDALGIKSAYITSEIKEQIDIRAEAFNYWSDYQNGEFTYGLLSQLSPDGNYAISTLKDHEIFVAKPDLEYSNFFFPIKGILVVYDRKTKTYKALKGACDTMMIQSNPSWSPDGKYIYFSKGIAVHTEESGLSRGTAVADSVKFNAFLESYLQGRRELKFDIYKIPFNNGEGGEAEPITGASNNNMSNYFPKISPDGKWLIFTKAKNFMLLQPDSKLYIMPLSGGEPREMKCNTSNMNSWHSWSPNSKWIVFSSKLFGPYTKIFLSHIDEHGNSSPPILIENTTPPERAVNIPEFVNISSKMNFKMIDSFSSQGNYNLFIRAFWLFNRGDMENALQTLNFAVKKDPKNLQAYELRGRVKHQLGDLKGALEDLNYFIKNVSDRDDAFLDRSNVKYALEDYQGAIEDCDNALLVNTRSSKAYYNRAVSKAKISDYEGALSDYNNAIKLNPGYIEAYYNRGSILYQNGDFSGAVNDFTKVINVKPDQAFVYLDRANAKDDLGDFKGALSDYDSALILQPNYTNAYFNRGIAKFNHGQYLPAIEDFNKSIKLDPDFAAAYYRRGNAYLMYGNQADGCSDLNKALTLGYKDAIKVIQEKYR